MVSNGGFESGTTPETTTSGAVSADSRSEIARSFTHFAWLDGPGFPHTGNATKSVTAPGR
ncbi:hypothetical protein [Streptomyces sp. NBC_00316]|uniref:hypothetical protein n=1 Tax=Streptomyces sp. NBC_00316 TaxID=2975710 RepID=UPI002E2D32A7|nr:hypothetical protein [Streptomyces sp. NBC_00316]